MAAVEAQNEESALVLLPARFHVMVLSQLSVVQLWRARQVSRHFNRWAIEFWKAATAAGVSLVW